MALKILDIRPDRALLDPNFDGYKLCLDKVPVLKKELTVPILTVLPSTDQYSYLNAKLFSTHNHLTGETFENTGSVYFINKGFEVQKAYVDGLLNEIHVTKVWNVTNTPSRKDGDYNFSLQLASEQLAVLSDGSGLLYLLDTGTRANDDTWQCIFSDEVIGSEKPFIIQDVVCLDNIVHCLLFHVELEITSKKNVAVLNWITLSKAQDNTWGCIALRELKCKGDIFYAHLAPNCNAIYCVSASGCMFTIDSENPIKIIPEIMVSKSYRWMQTSDFIQLKFNLPENYIADNIRVDLKEGEIDISYQNEIFLKGPFIHEIDIELCTWNVAVDILEISLKKKTIGTMWPEVVIGDTNGKYIITQNFESAQRNIEHLTSDTEVTARQCEFGPTFNSEQTEECDFEDEDTLVNFERLCVETHAITHRANLGSNSILLTTKRLQNLAPALVVRNDVDGCLWQPLENDADFILKHEATLFAFGYIQASKQQKKFSTCAPDLSYSVICESSRHIFIYQQNKPINNAELRNRTTGRRFGTVAQQHVISISGDEILGIYAANATLFLLTENSIIGLKL